MSLGPTTLLNKSEEFYPIMMTQIYITIAIIMVIVGLVCYIFIRQTINERKKAKQRLQRALEKRGKDLLQMLSAFPDKFLPEELHIFIYRCIIDTYEQLTKLAPSDSKYIEALKLYSSQMEEVIRQAEKQAAITLESTQQITEIKQNLKRLDKFLQKWLERKNMTSQQFSHYRGLIKDLMIKVTIDSYRTSAKQALAMDKPKISLHQYQLAKKLLTKETPTDYQQQIEKIDLEIAPLLEQAKALKEATEQAQDASDDGIKKAAGSTSEKDDEWSQFEEDSGWKKKNVYD